MKKEGVEEFAIVFLLCVEPTPKEATTTIIESEEWGKDNINWHYNIIFIDNNKTEISRA